MSFAQLAVEVAEEKLKKMRVRVKKLLTLSKDSAATENVSQASMLHAQRIMAEFNISEEEAMNEGVTDQAQSFMRRKEAYHKPVTEYMDIPTWYFFLANVISDNFKCYNYRQHWTGSRKATDKELKRIMFLGEKQDTILACDVFDFAVHAINYLSKEYMELRKDVSRGKKSSVKNDYILGYIQGLKAKFAEQVTELQIALVKDELVIHEFDKLKVTETPINLDVLGDIHARSQGYVDGKNFDQGRQRLT